MSSTSPYSKDPFHKFVDWVFSKIQKYKMELFFVTVAILLFAGCQNSIMNTLQKHIVGTLFKEIASHDILLRGGAVVFLLLCLVVFSRHIYHRYHYSSKQYFWVGFITSIYIVFRCFPPHCTQPTCWYWDFIPFSEHWSSIKYFDLWFLVPLGMGIVCLCGLLKKKKNKNQKADLLDDKEEERYYKLFPSRRIQVDFVLTQLNGLGSERSFAFGITCPWGGGKTSFLNGVKDRIQKNGWSKNDFIQREHLAEDIAEKCEKMYQKSDRFDITEKDVIFVDYKPWFASGSKHVVAHFLDALQKSLSPYDGELAGSIAKYRKLLLSLNPGVFKSFIDGTVDFFSVHKDIEDRFKNVEKCIQRLNKKILVFMDDLDRLEANELVASLKIIRNTGSFKNVVFFVTYDKEYVLSQLASHFNFDKKDKKQGDRFLEKFFQLEVPLPQLYPSELRKYVKDLINDNLPEEIVSSDLSTKEKIAAFFKFDCKLPCNFEIDTKPDNYEDKDEFDRKYEENQKRISEINLINEVVILRNWKRFINQVSLSIYLGDNDYDLKQLLLMFAFKQKFPREAYQLFCEINEKSIDKFVNKLALYSNEDRELIDELGDELNKRIYQIGNFDFKYIAYINVIIRSTGINQIGFFHNYLHYYNLSFPPSYIDEDSFMQLLNNPKEVWKNKNSKDEDARDKYLGFVKRFYHEKFDFYDKMVVFEIIIDAYNFISHNGYRSTKINEHQENVSLNPLILEKECFSKDLERIFNTTDFIPVHFKLYYLLQLIMKLKQSGYKSTSLESLLIRLFSSCLPIVNESILLFYLSLREARYFPKGVCEEIISSTNNFIQDHENRIKFLNSIYYLCVNKPLGYYDKFAEFDVFKELDPKFLDYIKTYERYDDLDVSKEKLLKVYTELVRLHNQVISVNK